MAEKGLTLRQDELVPLIEQKGLDDVLRPLIREIYLFDSYVSGTSYQKDPSVLDEITEGDKLILQRENSKFDDNAIMLLTEKQKKLGYVPEKDNVVFARLMDAGKLLSARIDRVEKRGSFSRIGIKIYLVDL